MTQSPDTQTVPIPAEFPLVWDDPADERLFWARDAMHFPRPVSPMTASLLAEVLEPALNASFEQAGLPIRARMRALNSYVYSAIAPLPLSPEEMQRLGAESEKSTAQLLARIGAWWDEEMLPQVQQHLAYWENLNLGRAPIGDALDVLNETCSRLLQVWTIHFLTVTPIHLAMSLFQDMYRDLIGDEDQFGAFRLLAGFDNKTLEGDRALWRLSRTALQTASVRDVLREQDAADALASLESIPDAEPFLDELHAFLQEYGRRSGGYDDVAELTWIEDPTPVIKNLIDFMGQPDRDLEADLRAQAEERETALAGVRAQLAAYPEAARGQFEFLLKAAQESTVLTEVHNYWIDFQSLYWTRQVLLACGRSLAETGVIGSADDVFYLTLPELRTALGNESTDLQAQVDAGRARYRAAEAVQPPPVLGTLPPGPPPDDPLTRSSIRFFGAPPPPGEEPGVLRGQAGAPGTIRGRARIIRSLAETHRLEAGDILVTVATAPAWTPLFATAAAVVTDTGGILSHCAVVAREYGIPAVVGTGMASGVIPDGQTIEVNGSEGVVRILDEE